jgi:hypothetical protein
MGKAKLNLPKKYLEWLDGLGKDARVASGDREWELATQKQLLKTVNIDGKKAPYIEQARLYVESIAEATGEESTFDDAGNDVPFSRLKKFLTIGYDNEDVLCVDPADGFSVWCFHPGDGGDIEKIAASLEKWIKDLEVSD